MPFHMLIHELIAKPKENPKEKMLSGCEIFFPDTIFFEKSGRRYIVHNDKDYCLAKMSESEDKNGISVVQALFAKLEKVINARKLNTTQHWLQLAKMERQKQMVSLDLIPL